MTDDRTETDRLDGEDLRRFMTSPDSVAGREAANRLLKRHRSRVYGFCFRFVRDHESALDLSQEVLMNAYRALPRYEHRTGFASWLFIIARNRCLKELRKRPLPTVAELDPDDLSASEPEPLDRLDAQDLQRLLRSCLDETEQEALHMRCVEGMPVDSITEILGLRSASGARGLLQRARRKLRAALDGPAERRDAR